MIVHLGTLLYARLARVEGRRVVGTQDVPLDVSRLRPETLEDILALADAKMAELEPPPVPPNTTVEPPLEERNGHVDRPTAAGVGRPGAAGVGVGPG